MFFRSAWPDRDRLWAREAPQVIVVVPHLCASQAVTQLERCDQGNMAGETGSRRGRIGRRVGRHTQTAVRESKR